MVVAAVVLIIAVVVAVVVAAVVGRSTFSNDVDALILAKKPSHSPPAWGGSGTLNVSIVGSHGSPIAAQNNFSDNSGSRMSLGGRGQ